MSSTLKSIKSRKSYWKKQTNIRTQKCKTKCTPEENTINECVITNTHISLRDCGNPDGITRYHYITPSELSVDSLQYAFDTNRVHLNIGKYNSSKKTNNIYLGIDNFPTLLIETEKTTEEGKFIDTRRDEGFYYAYEDSTTLAIISYEEQIKDYLEKGIYRTSLKYKELEEKDIPTNYKVGESEQNIKYVKEIAESIIGDKINYKCDLQGIPDKYIITEKITIGGEEFIICGYPDPSKMRTYLSMLENPKIRDIINDIHTSHKTQFIQLFADMHNFIISDIEPSKKITNLEEDLHKLVPPSMNLKYLKTWYEQNPKLREWINSTEFKEKIKYMDDNGLTEHKKIVMDEIEKSLIPEEEYQQELSKLNEVLPEYDKYINELLLEYLNKPMMRIRYYFLIFRKDVGQGLVPAVFNIKQLEPKHKPILEKVLDLIQIRIPEIFGILEDSRNNLDRYKLFHSYVKYGDFFYITTEYLHTMSNISHYSYIYKNSISLEELIYSTGRTSDFGNPFWKDLKLEYEIKKFRVNQGQSDSANQSGGAKNPYALLLNNNTRTNTGTNINTRTNTKVTIDDKTRVKKNIRSSSKTNKNNGKFKFRINGKILLLYEKLYQEYIIIYKYNEKILVLEIKSNMASIIDEIKQNIRNGNDISEDIYSCNNAIYRNMYYGGKLFILQKDIYEINIDTLNIILQNNPLYYAVSHKPNISNIKINFFEYYSIDLLNYNNYKNKNNKNKNNKNNNNGIKIYNLYNILPMFAINILFSEYYINALNDYNVRKISKTSMKIKNRNNREITSKKYGESNKFNVIINSNNCGYNFIEIYNDKTDKIVVWVLPFNNNKYLREYTELDEKHIPMLQEIINIYDDGNKLIFVHNLPTVKNYCLHIHIIDKILYKRHDGEKGSIFTREKYVKQILYNLITNKKYYNDYNVSNVIIK